MIQTIRQFLIEKEYLEVETPILIPAPPPEAHIDAISAETHYLQTSPEVCMKRLLAAGFSKIFQIAKCFRAKERGNLHMPEFTLLEWYQAGIGYHELMVEVEGLIRQIFQNPKNETIRPYQGNEFDLNRPWKKITVQEAFDRYASISLKAALEKNCFDDIMALEIEPELVSLGPVFLIDFPAPFAALARLKPEQPEFAERFEFYMAGIELANGFSELTDSREQRIRFKKERELRNRQGKNIYPMPENFLACLDHMPHAAGVAVGIDRLAMILTDSRKIDDVVCFTREEL